VACCPGSGKSILSGCHADVWLSGEMSHHDLLDAAHSDSSVILCEHSNSERRFLADWLKPRLESDLADGGILVEVAKEDRDPVEIV